MEIVGRDTPSLMWNAWNKDPTKAALLRALVSCQGRLAHNSVFSWDIGNALAQQDVCFYLSIFIERGEVHYLILFRSRLSMVLPSCPCPGSIFLWSYLLAMVQRKTSSRGVPIQHVASGALYGVMHAKCSVIVLTARVAWSIRFGDVNMGARLQRIF